MKQTVITVVTEINPAKRVALEQTLEQIRLNLKDNPFISFSSLTRLHFCSFVIADDHINTPLLIFESNFDGNVSEYIDQLVSVSGKGIHLIYKCCSAYQALSFRPELLKKFLTSKIVRPNAYYIGNVGRPAADIKSNQLLRQRLEQHLDNLFAIDNPLSFSANELRQNMVNLLKANVTVALPSRLPPHQSFLERVLPKVELAFIGLVMLVLAVGLFPLTILLIVKLRRKEDHDPVAENRPTISEIKTFTKTENQITQNHLANITQIKPGRFRLILLKTVLFAVNLAARISTHGKLSGIPSIHFAHWSIINHGKQLLFLSNFDGSWSSYLDDFVDKASPGLTGIWSNTQGFPYTRYLLADGARDEVRFKAFARSHQTASRVWYSAYPDLTVQNIDKDSKIRENLSSALTDSETKKWLELF